MDSGGSRRQPVKAVLNFIKLKNYEVPPAPLTLQKPNISIWKLMQILKYTTQCMYKVTAMSFSGQPFAKSMSVLGFFKSTPFEPGQEPAMFWLEEAFIWCVNVPSPRS